MAGAKLMSPADKAMVTGRTRHRVSIGMPVYNREKYVGAAIESYLAQSYPDFELIISDNASTDRCEEICRAYAARDPRIQYHRSLQNLGATRNFHRCFELSTGEYFCWIPSDDLVSPNFLERAVAILDQDPSVLVAYGRTKLIDAEGNLVGEFDDKLHLMDDQPSVRWKGVAANLRLGNLHYGLNRSDKLRRTGLLRNYIGGDFPFIAEMSLYGKFYEIPDAYFYRRMHSAAASALSRIEIMSLLDPSRSGDIFLYHWVHLGANLKSVARAPIRLAEKLRIFAFEGRRLIWSRREFMRELTGAAGQAVRRLTES